ncbi:MAG: hypothetical protein HYZ50_16175 [Deltaproteobacteria bacterium]|nr:hypothetical protein [Deltaproteobacteria bacterium]
MTLDEHALNLGGLFGNLQSLEFLLRGFLNRLSGARPIGVPYGTDIYSFPVGTELPENDLTSYDSLSLLVAKFNQEMKCRGTPEIDEKIVELRDALVHGRVSAAIQDESLRLLKFDEPKNGTVRITFNEVMTEEWFKEQKGRVYAAI